MEHFVILFVVVAVCSTVHAHIVRPCDLDDYKCIGENLEANSRCSSNVKGHLPNTYYVNEFPFEAPYFNASYIDKDLIVKNHDLCFISEFFFNTVTYTAVLTIDCPYLDLESDRVLIQHRSKKEDSIYSYHCHATYPKIRITTRMLTRNHMDLCDSHVSTEVVQPPSYHIKPKDDKTTKFLTKDASLLDIFERENFCYRGYPLLRIFIDTLICDYNCQPHII